MKDIILLAGPGDKGTSVKALHEALLDIFSKRSIPEYANLVREPGFLDRWNSEYRESLYGAATEQAVRIFQERQMGVIATGVTDGSTAAAINKVLGVDPKGGEAPVVSGKVYDEWIEPMAGVPVMIFDQGMRHEHLLGEGQTDTEGRYSLSYSIEKLARRDRGGANLVVKLFNTGGEPVYCSPVKYNSPAQWQVNINLGPRDYQGLSEFVKNVELVRGYIGDLKIGELTENKKIHDLTFLISKTGIGVNVLLGLVAAFRFGKWTGLEAEVFYGILSQEEIFGVSDPLPADVDMTIEQAYVNFWTAAVADDITALEQAAMNNTVTYSLLKRKTQIQAALQKLQGAPPQETGATQSLPPVYANLTIAGLTDAQRQAFLTLYSNTTIDANFWVTLGQSPAYQGQAGGAAIGELQVVFQLAGWTWNDTGLISYLIQTLSIHSPADFSGLVSKTVADWVQVIEGAGNGSGAGSGVGAGGANAQVQAETIAENIEMLYPMAVFSDRFAKAVSWKVPNRDYLTGILQSSDFNLVTTTANQYLNTYTAKNPLPAGVTQDVVAGQLMAMQRVYRISQNSDTSLSMLGSNIQSARQIYAMGQSSFVTQYQQQLGGAAQAEAVFSQAAGVHASAMHVTGQLISRLNNPAGNILPNLYNTIGKSSLATNYPDLANLFGMADSYCECKDCRSILGIPAYLADLLDFLACRATTADINGEPGNTREVLLSVGRRPDIADIDLSCKNTNVELPYIDLVNELLEDYIIPPVAALPLKFTTSADALKWFTKNLAPGTITKELYTELLKIATQVRTPICNISLLSRDATVSNWYVTDDWNFPNTENWGNVVQFVIRDKYITLKLVANVIEENVQHPSDVYIPGYQPVLVPMQGNNDKIHVLELVVQEIHETHLPADVISTNPEYTNTNVYNCLSLSMPNLWDLYPTLIPVGLPFDLYFTESNVYLNKMGLQRADLINTFRDQQTDPTTGYTKSINSIVNAYLGLTPGDTSIIFTAAPAGQAKYWGSMASNPTPEVDQFLTVSGLSFTELQTILTLEFINGQGKAAAINDPAVVVNGYSMENCNIARMTITNMITTVGSETISRYDLVNRFLRLWRKVNLLTPVSMEELDACIMSTILGNGSLDATFGINLYYFLEVMSQMNLSATQALVLYQPMDTSEKGSLYQQLFLNRQVTNPLVAVFQLPANGSAISIDLTLHPEAIPVILTVCSVQQADLTAILALINPSGNPLDIEMLSFIYACGLLADYLSINVSDLFTFAALTGVNPVNKILPTVAGAVPAGTTGFIGLYNEIQQAGFTVDGINYVVADVSNASPSLIPAPNTVVSGLESIRTALQGAVSAATVMPDPQGSLLKKWLADPALNWSPGLVTALLSILATTDDDDFISLVQENLVLLQGLAVNYASSSGSAYLDTLPAVRFPDPTVAQIGYDHTNYFLFFNGPMTALEQTYLNALSGADTAAINALYEQSQLCPIAAAPLGVTSVPGWLTTNFASIRLNAPGLSCDLGALRFTGNMTGAVYNSLLAQSGDAGYSCALSQLFVQCQNITPATTVYVQLASLPSIGLPDGNPSTLAYSNGLLEFGGVMSAADALALLGLSNEQAYQYAICELLTSAVAGQTVSTPLASLPSAWAFIPDISGIDGLSLSPAMLTFSGMMTEAQLETLLAINVTTDPWDSFHFYGAVNALYTMSQPGVVSAVPLVALPVGVSAGVVPGLGYSLPALCFAGQMSSAVQTALGNLSAAAGWTANLASLFNLSQSTNPPTTIAIAALPAGVTAALLSSYGVTATATQLSYAGVMSVYLSDLLLGLSTNANWVTAVTDLYQQSQPTLVSSVTLPLPVDLNVSLLSPQGIIVSGSNPVTMAYSGQMTAATMANLLTCSIDASYQAAIGLLFNQTSAIFGVVVPAVAVPLADSAVGSTAYAPGSIVFTGTPNLLCNDEFNLQLLNSDPDYQNAIGFIYNPSLPSSETSLPAGTIGVILHAMPPIVFPSGMAVSWSDGVMSFTGQMAPGDRSSLLALSNVASYQAAVNELYDNSQITSIVTVPALADGSFPDGVSLTDLQTNGVKAQLSGTAYILSYTGLMSSAQESALLGLVPAATNDDYTKGIQQLFTDAATIVVNTVPLAALPPAILSAAALAAGWYYDAVNLVLYYQGAYAALSSALATLTGGMNSTDADFLAALSIFSSHTMDPGSNVVVFAPPPLTPFADSGIVLSNAGSSISYQGGTISVTGTLSFADYLALLALSSDQAYQEAVTNLYAGMPVLAFGAPAISIPAIFSKQLSFSAATSTLTLAGEIGAGGYSALLAFGTSTLYQQAMAEVYAVSGPAEAGGFSDVYFALLPLRGGVLTALDVADRYAYFLNSISPVYQGLKQAEALTGQLAANFGISAAVAEVLVGDLGGMLSNFTAVSFVGNSKPINPDPDQFLLASWYVRLAKLSFVINSWALSAVDTDWLLTNTVAGPNVFSKIANPNPADPLTFSDWEPLNDAVVFQRSYGQQTTEIGIGNQKTMPLSVFSIISVASELTSSPANPGALLSQLVQLTRWSLSELLYLLNIGQPDLPNLKLNPLDLSDSGNPAIGCAESLTDISFLLRLAACFSAAAQLKVVPSRCVNWVSDPITSTTAMDIKQALKSQYPDTASWESAIVPLMNTLRQERRDALVRYLLTNTVTNVFGTFSAFADEFAIYSNFLIDVEMGACQPSTRLIQAYCSVQSFVQRCFLGIEPNISTGLDPVEWGQWSWMGAYESWYEARYVFLYPENFILPQALPNPSPFFVDMQNDLTQGAVTPAIVETAFENYIESLDGIAQLQVAGMWYDDSTGNLYVFACTHGADPAVYYFRVMNGLQQWSPWEQVTADVPAGQVIPLVQNGRLYLYWPVFTQASEDDKSSQPIPTSSGGGSTPTPVRYWQIQMAFSEYRNGKWSGKKMSSEYLSSGQITAVQGNPVVYPDTTDFVFIALDIPPQAAAKADVVKDTQESLLINNNMAIVCCQYMPNTATVAISGYLNGNTSSTHTLNIPVSIITQSFNMHDLIQQIATIFGSVVGSVFTYNMYMTSTDVFPVTAIIANYAAINQSVINSMNAGMTAASNSGTSLNDYHFTVTGISGITIKPQSDTLTVLSNTAAPANGFALDPLRGYPATATLSDIGKVIDDCWFKGGSFDNALCEGGLPLQTNKGTTILQGPVASPPLPITYANLLPLQMGLWSKYACISGSTALSDPGVLMPFFYQDTNCTFYVLQATAPPYYTYEAAAIAFEALDAADPVPSQFTDILNNSTMVSGPSYQFFNFYHPFAHYFIRIVAELGMAGVLTRAIQLTGDPSYGGAAEVTSNLIATAGYKGFSFSKAYQPAGNVVNITNSAYKDGFPIQQMDFDLGSSYSQYNWELFFHGVLLSAMQLSQNQQFADAEACFNLIFNPSDSTGHSVPHKYWETKPFFKNAKANQSIDQLITEFITDPSSQTSFGASVAAWRNDPYDPHMLAMVRITPYMYTTFMKYLDNLIAWANNNYAQYTMETVNFAIQLFMLALELLGAKPEAIPSVVEEPVCTYNQLERELDTGIIAEGAGYLSDPIVQVENLLSGSSSGSGGWGPNGGTGKKLPVLSALYFCIPPNEVLLAYWDTVETQLTKIRNCLNIQGQFQPLSPFPNVPGLGGQEGSGVADFGGVLPNYRFSVMIQKATELCNEVKSLGASLLSALEKEDAEGLALLHATQEIAVQQSIDKVKQLQITDAQLSLQNLQNYQQLVNDKIAYYSGLIQQGLLSLEQQALTLNQTSLAMQDPIAAASIMAKVLNAVPNFTLGMAGFGGSPVASMVEGGSQFGSAADAFVTFMTSTSQFIDKAASIANVNAGYSRRIADWNFQLTMANDELTQVNTQIQAANNKIAIATQDEANQQLLIRNAEDVSSFLENKYTNQQLYSWMVTQISNVYFQSYQLAYSFAKQTEVCFGYELGIAGASYINYGYWDSLHSGLLSGEALMTSLKQMETDYLNFNYREYELTRQISLAQLDPAALLQLKSGGSCFINIAEELFDLDYPGHYFRRVKHIAVTIPGVVGPYTPVCLKMTLLSNSVRMVNTAGTPNNYPRHANSKGVPTNDSRFLDSYAAIQYIATSNGVNDSGLFEMNLHDERYLPFERAGAISSWQLELTSVYPQFDPETITDLIVHFSYTSRDGGAALQAVATESVQGKLQSAMTTPGLVLMRGFSARRDFPTQWYKFLNPANPGDTQQLVMDITRRFPFFTNGLRIKITRVALVADLPSADTVSGSGGPLSNLYLSGVKLSNALLQFGTDPDFSPQNPGADIIQYSSVSCKDGVGAWTITNGTGSGGGATAITSSEINDLSVIFYYSLVNNTN